MKTHKQVFAKPVARKAPRKVPKFRSPIRLGNTVFCRTVTHYYTGKIVILNEQEIVLQDAAWIADTGRFHQAMATGELNEVEPYPSHILVSLSRGAGCDVSDWPWPLPRTAK